LSKINSNKSQQQRHGSSKSKKTTNTAKRKKIMARLGRFLAKKFAPNKENKEKKKKSSPSAPRMFTFQLLRLRRRAGPGLLLQIFFLVEIVVMLVSIY